jgi:tetratricopeptide (TPR) repeat protein
MNRHRFNQDFRVSRRMRFLFLLLIILIGVLFYRNTLQNDFVWDDRFLITDNLYIRSIKFLPAVFTTDLHRFGLERSNFYRPLQTISYMLDYAIAEYNTWPYHLTNLLLHLISGLLIYFVALKLCKNDIISFLTSFIFVAHPVQTESVTYLSDRADLLVAAFILGGFLSFLHYCSKPRLLFFLTFNLCFILALLSKEIALIFPLLIFSWAKFYGQKERTFSLRATSLSLGGISIVYILLRLSLLRFSAGALGLGENEVFGLRFLTSFKALWRYFVLLVFPRHLHMERNFPWVGNLAEPALWAGIALLAGSFVLAKRFFRREKYISFAVIWFYISLFPVINIIPVNAIMSEHWLYLPSFSFALILAYFIFQLYQLPARWIKPALSVLLAANFSFYSFKVITRNAEWKDEETLYRATLRYQPQSSRVYYNLGNVYAWRGEYQKAIDKYLVAVELKEDYAVAWNNLGLANYRLGKIDSAIEKYHRSLKYKPDLAAAHNNLGLALDRKGRQEQARGEFEKAIRYDADYADPHNGLGIYYARRKNWSKAVFHFQEALKIKPDFADAASNLKRVQLLQRIKK